MLTILRFEHLLPRKTTLQTKLRQPTHYLLLFRPKHSIKFNASCLMSSAAGLRRGSSPKAVTNVPRINLKGLVVVKVYFAQALKPRLQRTWYWVVSGPETADGEMGPEGLLVPQMVET